MLGHYRMHKTLPLAAIIIATWRCTLFSGLLQEWVETTAVAVHKICIVNRPDEYTTAFYEDVIGRSWE